MLWSATSSISAVILNMCPILILSKVVLDGISAWGVLTVSSQSGGWNLKLSTPPGWFSHLNALCTRRLVFWFTSRQTCVFFWSEHFQGYQLLWRIGTHHQYCFKKKILLQLPLVQTYRQKLYLLASSLHQAKNECSDAEDVPWICPLISKIRFFTCRKPWHGHLSRWCTMLFCLRRV